MNARIINYVDIINILIYYSFIKEVQYLITNNNLIILVINFIFGSNEPKITSQSIILPIKNNIFFLCTNRFIYQTISDNKLHFLPGMVMQKVELN